jgi:hypothetical protein
MRWKDVFMIWLWADVLLGAGAVIFAIFTSAMFTGGPVLMLLVLLYGLLISLPSLVIMLLFHAICRRKSSSNYFWPYTMLILSVNIAYWITGTYFLGYTNTEYIAFIGCTILAGLLGFAIVNNTIQKREKQNVMEQW